MHYRTEKSNRTMRWNMNAKELYVRIWKEAALAYLKVLFRYSFEGAEENDETPSHNASWILS
jgi:hypothetical protein